MGQPIAPLAPTSQQLNEAKAAAADNNGNATFTFDSPPVGQTWTGTLCCVGAPIAAVFTASIGATPWGDWGGNSVAGPVQAFGTQQLVVNATGLTPGTFYLLTWTGSADPSTEVAAIWPDPTSSALTAEITSGTVNIAGVVNTQSVDLIGSGFYTGTGAGAVSTFQINTTKAYEAIVVVTTSAARPQYMYVTNFTNSLDSLFSSAAFGDQQGNGTQGQAIAPLSVQGPTSLAVSLVFGGATALGAFFVYGLTVSPVAARPDGRARPIGSNVFDATSPITQNLLSAITWGRYLLKYVNVNGGTASPAGFALQVTSRGVNCFPVSVYGLNNAAMDFDDGFLCDVNTPVGANLFGGGVQSRYTIIYDIVI